MSIATIRKDGKKPRTPRLGLPATTHNGLTQPADQDRENWHELVQHGPKGDPLKRVARAQRRAASRTREAAVIPLVDRQQTWHFDHTPNSKPGRLVLHKLRLPETVDSRPTNKRLRYVAKVRRAFGLPA